MMSSTPDADGFLDAVLNDRLVDERQHFLGLRLGGRQEPRAEAGRGEDGFANAVTFTDWPHRIAVRDAV